MDCPLDSATGRSDIFVYYRHFCRTDDPILFHLVAQDALADPQPSGRLRLTAVRRLKGTQYQLPFQLRNRLAHRRRGGLLLFSCCVAAHSAPSVLRSPPSPCRTSTVLSRIT